MGELGQMLVAVLAVAIGGGLIYVAIWKAHRPPTPALPMDLGGFPLLTVDLFLAFFLWFFWQWFVFGVLHKSPALARIYGMDPDRTSLGLWTAAVSTPFVVLTILLSLSTLRGISPSQWLGIPGRRWADVAVGYLAWLVWTPPVLLLYLAISLAGPVEKHPFEMVGRTGVHAVDWVLFVVSAVVMAPVVEELLFRGIVLRWLWTSPVSAHMGIAVLTLVVAALPLFEPEPPMTELEKALAMETYEDKPSRWEAPIFVIALWPGYFWLIRKARFVGAPYSELDGSSVPRSEFCARRLMASIYGSSLFFAVMHSRVWPTPIPLFFLSLGLGWVAFRTGGLVAPVIMHALFNGVACLEVVLAYASR